jgi:hypothetical protein
MIAPPAFCNMWIELTEDHLLTRLSGKELEKLRAAALAAGQADPVQDIFDAITRKVRSRVPAGWPRGAGNTIPNEMLSDALALCLVEISTRPGGILIDPESQRAKAADQAEANLDKLSKGQIQIEAPADASTETPSAPVGGDFGSQTKIKMRTET